MNPRGTAPAKRARGFRRFDIDKKRHRLLRVFDLDNTKLRQIKQKKKWCHEVIPRKGD
jgi:hypothetical protein